MIIPYGKHVIDSSDIEYVKNTLKSDFITQGPLVKKFERNLKHKVNSKYCVAVNSATSALHISCLALGMNEKKLVWTVPNTFVSTANAALFCNSKIDFVEIDINNFNISINFLKKKINRSKKKKINSRFIDSCSFSGKPYICKRN